MGCPEGSPGCKKARGFKYVAFSLTIVSNKEIDGRMGRKAKIGYIAEIFYIQFPD